MKTLLNTYNNDKNKTNERALLDAVKTANKKIELDAYTAVINSLSDDTNTLYNNFALATMELYKVEFDKDTFDATIKTEQKAYNFARCDSLYKKQYIEKRIENGTSKADAKKEAVQITLCNNPDALHMMELFAVNIANNRIADAQLKVKFTHLFKPRHPERFELFTKQSTSRSSLEKQLNAIKTAIGFKGFNFNRSDLAAIMNLYVKANINKTNDINYVISKVTTLINCIFATAKARIENKQYTVVCKEKSIVTPEEKKTIEKEAQKNDK